LDSPEDFCVGLFEHFLTSAEKQEKVYVKRWFCPNCFFRTGVTLYVGDVERHYALATALSRPVYESRVELLATRRGECDPACPIPLPKDYREKELVGECRCGKIGFKGWSSNRTHYHCHCRTCQIHTGSAFATWTPVCLNGFHSWGPAKEKKNKKGTKRWFCPSCGTHLYMKYGDDEETGYVASNCLNTCASDDEEIGYRVAGFNHRHIFLSERSEWDDHDYWADDIPCSDGH